MNEKTEQRLTVAWKVAGWCLVAVSLYFIAVRVARTPMDGLAGAVTTGAVAVIFLFSIIYSLLNVLLAFAWALLYRMASREGPSVAFMAGVHLRTGVVKYLPGNVFHLAGRHVLAGTAGAGQGPVLAANVLEMGIIVAAALAIVAATAGPGYLDRALDFFRGWLDTAGTIIAIVLLAAASGGTGAYLAWKFRRVLNRTSLLTMLPVFSGYLVFFAVAALLLNGLVARMIPPGSPGTGYPTVLGVFCLSWIAGFVVPGAPGGLGIRESVIVAALSPVLGDAPALAAALLLRAVTMAGDLVSFGYSFLAPRGGGVTSVRT